MVARKKNIVAVDTETTGLTLRHGCRPFFVSMCNQDGEIAWWKWEVDPLTRLPSPPKKDLKEIQFVISDTSNRLVFHNAKFDVLALESIGIKFDAWDRVEDTHLASHCLASNEPHGLKELGLRYLDIDDDDESDLQKAVNQARTKGRRYKWNLGRKQHPNWPWIKTGKWWKTDMWVPAAVAKHENLPESHPWWTVLDRYAITDAERTIALYLMFEEALKDEKLWDQYKARRNLLPIVYRMESHGITVKKPRVKELKQEYQEYVEDYEKCCQKLTPTPIDNLSSPPQLQKVLFSRQGFHLSPTKETKGSKVDKPNYSTAAEDLEPLLLSLPERSRAYHFIDSLFQVRRNEKAVGYLDSYLQSGQKTADENFYQINCNFNIAGTATTRFSSNNPNAQNISKRVIMDDNGNIIQSFNLRRGFGPLPGKVWYANDYNNIEMRIFAYQSGDKQLIKAFEDGYSVHLIFAKLLYPKQFALCEKKGWDFKEHYKATLYQWVKNGNFSLIYGAGIAKADRTYHVDGAYKLIRKKMPQIDRFMAEKHREATELGFVTTLGGYRLGVPKDGPHKAVNYYVQGSAGWAMLLAMRRIDAYLQTLPSEYQMIMTIHDELDIEMPLDQYHHRHAKRCRELMERSGDDLGMPLPVEVNRIEDNWASETKCDFKVAA